MAWDHSKNALLVGWFCCVYVRLDDLDGIRTYWLHSGCKTELRSFYFILSGYVEAFVGFVFLKEYNILGVSSPKSDMAITQEQDLSPHHQAMWLKAMSALQLGNPEYTIPLMQSLLREYPDFLAGRRLLRQAGIAKSAGQRSVFRKIYDFLYFTFKARMKNPYAILETVEKLLEHDPYHRYANWLLYTIAKTCNMPETAAFALETLLEGHPRDFKGMYQLAEHYAQQNQPQKAVEIYHRILKIAPTDIIAIQASKNAAAQAFMQSGRWDQEETTYRDLRKEK